MDFVIKLQELVNHAIFGAYTCAFESRHSDYQKTMKNG